jgi:putative transposase
VDTTGLLIRVVVHPANIRDAEGAKFVLIGLRTWCPSLQRIWGDAGYRGELGAWVQRETGCQLEVVARPSTARWVRVGPSAGPAVSPPVMPAATSFRVLPRRWVVERTFAWIGRFRRLSKDYEGLTTSEEAWVLLVMSRIMLHRLAPR